VTITPVMPATAHKYRKRCPTPLCHWVYPNSLPSHEGRASHGDIDAAVEMIGRAPPRSAHESMLVAVDASTVPERVCD